MCEEGDGGSTYGGVRHAFWGSGGF
jgi:hypothetical protein